MNKPMQKETISRRIIACIASATLTLSMIPISAIAFASTTELPEADAPAEVQADTTQASDQNGTQPAGNTQGTDSGQKETPGTETGSTEGQGGTENVTGTSQEDPDAFMPMNVEGDDENNEPSDKSEFDSLDEAIQAGQPYTLQNDLSVDGYLDFVGKDISLNLGGHTLSVGSLRVVNGSLSLSNGTVTRGSVASNNGTDTDAMVCLLNFTSESKSVSFDSVNFKGIKAPNEFNLAVDVEGVNAPYSVNLKNCNVSGPMNFYQSEVVIKGGIYNSTEYFDGQFTSPGFYVRGNSHVEIQSAIFNVASGAPLASEADKSTLKIYGGTFTDINGNPLDISEYLADGLKLNENGEVIDSNVAQVGETKYETLPAAIEAAQDGDTITLLADVTVDETYNSSASLEIRKGLTIDGQGHTIACAKTYGIRIFGGPEDAEAMKVTLKDVTVTNANPLGRAVETRGGNVELVLDHATVTTTGAGNTQVFTVGGKRTNATSVTIKNGSKLIASQAGYGILTFNPVNMTIDNSEVSGYGALYFKGPDSSAGSAGSKIDIVNDAKVSSTGLAGSTNTFGTIVFQESDITVNVKNATVAVTADPSNDPETPQAAFMFSSWAAAPSAEINISGNSFVEMINEHAAFVRNMNDQSKIVVSGGKFSSDVTDYCIEGYKTTLNDVDNLYHFVAKTYVAAIGDAQYETLSEALEAAQDGDTVLLLKDVDAVTVKKTVTIDLGGCTINKMDVAGNGADKPGITATIYNGTVETADITNRGKILSNKIEMDTVNATNGRLETNGGTYGTVNVTAGGNIHINSGSFTTVNADGAGYASIKNGAFGTVTIKNTKTKSISGGTFDTFTDKLRSAVVAGKIVVKKDGKFAVMSMSQVVATADGWGYMALDDAINAVKNGGTVELLKDNKVDTWNQIWDVKDVTINGNGKTLTVGKIESGVNGNFLLYRAQNLVVNDLNIVLNNGGAFDMTDGTIDNVSVTGGRFAVSGASNTTITNCAFTGQSDMAIYTDDTQGAPGLVVDGCTFTETRVGILRANEQIVNCTVSGPAGWYQLTVVGANAVVSGNSFSGNDRALELYGQPANITRNNLENAGDILISNEIDAEFTEADLSANYWGGSYPTDIENAKIESYYDDAEMTHLVFIEKPGDDQGNQGSDQPTNPGTTNPGTTNPGTTNAPQGGNAGPTIINRTVTLQPTAATADDQPAEAIADDATPLASNAQAESEDIEDDSTPMASFDQGQLESDQVGLIDWTVVALSIAGLAVLGGLFFLLARKRRKDEEEAA